MELPITLQAALTKKLSGENQEEIINGAKLISTRYREREKGQLFIKNGVEALSYALARMPATYGAVHKALEYTAKVLGKEFNSVSLLDVGAGTGAATWAANSVFKLTGVNCLEYVDEMINLGKGLMEEANIKNALWRKCNIIMEPISERADLVIASYLINELNEQEQLTVAEKLWNATNKVLVIAEPGTPAGFAVVKRIRTHLLEKGAFVVAPCPHGKVCKLSQGDWCHFTCRIQRQRLHKIAKGGELSYEDEKFAYLALSKNPVQEAAENKEIGRILRHPYIGKGHVKLELCTKNGLQQKTIAKGDKALYKLARKAECGDSLNF